MNMISTGAFQTEMDASNKQPTLAEKFAAVWEKKNSKAARAGGVSLMALSLAACGSDDDTTTTSTTDTTTTTTDTTTTTTPAALSLVGTTGIDVLTGDGGDDTFLFDSGTVSAADSAAGAAGTDTVKVYGSTTIPSMTGVENLEVHHGTAADFNIASGNLAAITSLTLDGIEVNNTTVTIAQGDSLSIVDATDSVGATDVVNVAGATTVTSYSLSVENSGASGAPLVIDTDATKVTTINLTSTGADATNYVEFTTAGGTAAPTTVNITATGKGIDLEDIDDATTIDASSSTAPVSLDTAVAKVTVTGGSGKDTLVMDHGASAQILSVSAGAGDDTVTLTSLTAATHLTDSKTTLDGGAGTDTLTMKSAAATALGALSSTAFAKKGISNFEKIALTDTQANGGSYNISNFGVNHVSLAVDEADDFTITGVTSGFTLTTGTAVDDLGGSGSTDDVTITLSDRAGDGDVVNLDINNTTGTSDLEFAMAEVEIVNIDTLGSDQANVVDLNTAQLKTITVATKTGNVTIDMSATGNAGLNVSTVDASGSASTGGVIFTADASNLSGITFTGGTGGDNFTGGDLSDVVISGSGDDNFDMGAGGANTIDLTGGGSDTIEINSLTGFTTVTGFATGDILDFENAQIDGGESTYTGQITGTLDLTDDTVAIFTINASTTAAKSGGSQTIADFTDTTDVAAYLEEILNIVEAEDVGVVLNDGTNSYAYHVDVDADTTVNDRVDAGDVTLLATVNSHILVAADVTQS